MTLNEYVRELAGRPFKYGECDCMLALADWLRLLTGKDAGRPYRGRYTTAPEWRQLVEEAGGLVAMVDRLAPFAGIVRVERALPADVGIIRVPGIGEAGAIRTGLRWVMKLGPGLSGAQAPLVVAAWGARF